VTGVDRLWVFTPGDDEIGTVFMGWRIHGFNPGLLRIVGAVLISSWQRAKRLKPGQGYTGDPVFFNALAGSFEPG
jgi:hypothetical protein